VPYTHTHTPHTHSVCWHNKLHVVFHIKIKILSCTKNLLYDKALGAKEFGIWNFVIIEHTQQMEKMERWKDWKDGTRWGVLDP